MCCVVYSNDPVRCKITLDEIWKLCHPKGIDSTFYPSQDQPDSEFYLKLVTSDINPYNPKEERYKEDIERELAKLNIVQDHIREFEPYTHFNNKKSRTIETILDEKVFSKDNRYDVLIDKYDKQWHYLPTTTTTTTATTTNTSNKRKFITIEDS